MSKHKGCVIVIEGTDGSGKTTQFKLLQTALKKTKRTVGIVDLPQYGKPSARLVERYLTGEYGRDPNKISPYDASLFYAVDRFEFTPRIRTWLQQGRVVIANRYTQSSAAHQGAKLKGKRKQAYWQWLYHLEHEVLDIPKPDLVIILHVPARIAQHLISYKKKRAYLRGKKDIHETNLQHLLAAEKTYLELAHTYHYLVVECVEKGRLLTPAEIHNKVWNIVKKIGL